VKIFVAAIALMALASPPVAAALWPESGGGLLTVQMQRPRPGGMDRQPPRDMRRPEQPPQPAQGQQRPNGRLTDDERRDLHRDLDRANREIYKGRQ
jgi:hypothetical protein